MLTVFVIILAALSALLVYLLYRTKVAFVRYEKTIKRFAELANIPSSRSPVAIYNVVRTLIRDRTEEIKRVSEKLKYMENVLDNLGDALFITDSEGRVEFINKSAKELVKSRDLLGKKMNEIIDNYYIVDLLEDAVKSGSVQQTDLTIFHPKRRFYECKAIPVSYGEKIHCLLILRDITMERNLELMRREFVSNVSHELRTPLTSIHGYAETLLEYDLSDVETVRKFLRIIEGESARMTRLINDLLDLEKLEAGDIQLVLEDVELSEVGEYVIKIVSPLAEELGVSIYEDMERGVFVEGDFDRLVQLTLNLVDNAVKYTSVKEHGPKEVWIRVYAANNYAVLEVEDTGIGIPEEARKHIFERFYRVDKARSRKMGGTGLGLAIVKLIAEKHGGTVSLDSEFGNGTTFKVRLPLKKVIE